MSAALTRRIPPQRLIDLGNPLVRAVLRSPLHAALDHAVLILHVVGRKSGRRYDIPVGYVDLNSQLVVVTQHGWRANLRGGADLDVTRRGRRQRMHAQLDEDPTSVATTLQRVIRQLGPKAARRLTGLSIDASRPPSLGELAAAAREFDLSTLTLTDGPDRPPRAG